MRPPVPSHSGARLKLRVASVPRPGRASRAGASPGGSCTAPSGWEPSLSGPKAGLRGGNRNILWFPCSLCQWPSAGPLVPPLAYKRGSASSAVWVLPRAEVPGLRPPPGRYPAMGDGPEGADALFCPRVHGHQQDHVMCVERMRAERVGGGRAHLCHRHWTLWGPSSALGAPSSMFR